MNEKGFKGFNKNLQCTPNGKVFQYEVGKSYEESHAKLCEKSSATGYKGASSAGCGAVALAVGYKTKVKGEIGAWIVATEGEQRAGETFVKDCKAAFVDGVEIKADTWYTLENGRFIEVK